MLQKPLLYFIVFLLTITTGFAQTKKRHPVLDMTPAQARKLINDKIMAVQASTPEVDFVKNGHVSRKGRQTPIRIYRPSKDEALPLVIFIHGGAWVAGSLDTHDNLARYLAKNSKSVVVSVGYTLSPEGKYDHILEQCYDVLLWCKENKSALGVTDKISLVGDSAGGNISAVVALLAAERKGPKIHKLALLNPAPDLRCGGSLTYDETPINVIRWQAKLYVHKEEDANSPLVSPMVSEKLSDLPPTLVVLAENDYLLYQDGYDFAQKLIRAGVKTDLYVQKGIGHLAGDGARASDKAKPSLNHTVTYLKENF